MLLREVASIAARVFVTAAVLSLSFFYDRHSLRIIALLFSNHDWGDIGGPCCDANAHTKKLDLVPKLTSQRVSHSKPPVKAHSCTISPTLLTF